MRSWLSTGALVSTTTGCRQGIPHTSQGAGCKECWHLLVQAAVALEQASVALLAPDRQLLLSSTVKLVFCHTMHLLEKIWVAAATRCQQICLQCNLQVCMAHINKDLCPAADGSECYLNSTTTPDLVGVFEDTAANYAKWTPPAWHAKYPAYKVSYSWGCGREHASSDTLLATSIKRPLGCRVTDRQVPHGLWLAVYGTHYVHET